MELTIAAEQSHANTAMSAAGQSYAKSVMPASGLIAASGALPALLNFEWQSTQHMTTLEAEAHAAHRSHACCSLLRIGN